MLFLLFLSAIEIWCTQFLNSKRRKCLVLLPSKLLKNFPSEKSIFAKFFNCRILKYFQFIFLAYVRSLLGHVFPFLVASVVCFLYGFEYLKINNSFDMSLVIYIFLLLPSLPVSLFRSLQRVYEIFNSSNTGPVAYFLFKMALFLFFLF